jgi:hypothetical protein
MLSAIWDFVSDASNRTVLGWIGGAIVVVAGGIWAVIKFLAKLGDLKPPKPGISADHRSMAAGRDININARDNSQR